VSAGLNLILIIGLKHACKKTIGLQGVAMQINKFPLYAGKTRAPAKKYGLYAKKSSHRILDKDLLPLPTQYYSQQFPGMKIKSEWVLVKCCFHDDNHPSLGINIVHGYYKCFACAVKGGDIISFHMKRYNLNFKDAVTELKGWRYE
jgi:hypothetical protein